MSINVNVSGNPVSIRRGQMFMSDIDTFKKKETQRRRKARIEQVRQQSKVVANEVRNRHKKAASETLSGYEDQQQSELEKWTAKRLLNLHEQYNECMNRLGEAHRQAAAEESPERVLSQQRKHNSAKARERGKKAWQQMADEEARREREKQKSYQRKLVNRTVEDVRSSMVSKLNKTPKKKKKRKDSDRTPNIPRKKSPDVERCQNIDTRRNNVDNCETYRVPDETPAERFKCTEDCTCGPSSGGYVPGEDNRLSKLIQRRLDSHETQPNEYQPHEYEPSSPRPFVRPQRPPSPVHVEQIDLTDDSALHERLVEPSVEHYDHNNRYSHRYTPKEKLVQKHTMVDKAVLFPTEEERTEWDKRNKERERAAQRRGREAMRKEKLKRDRERLLQDLNKLHKEEQLYNAYTRKVDGHLSEERLREKQAKRQQELEQAFENIYTNHTPLITLESVESTQQQLPTKDLPGPGDDPQVNVAEWELTGEQSNHELDSLRELLDRIATQRQLLRQEIASFQPEKQPAQSSGVEPKKKEARRKVCPCTKKKRKISTPTTSRLVSGSSKLTLPSTRTTETTTTGTSPHPTVPRTSSTTQTTLESRSTRPSFKYKTGSVQICMKENGLKSSSEDGVVLQPSGSSSSNGIQIIIKVNDKAKTSTKSASTSPCLDMKETSTSTSYYSPPERFTVEKTTSQTVQIKADVHPRPIRFLTPEPSAPVRRVPSELSSRTKQMIEKLLVMSRQSVENLAVSSSEVATPDLAIIDTSTNLLGNSRSTTMSSEEIIFDDIFSKSSSRQSTEGRLAAGTDEYKDLATFCTKRIDRLTEMIQKVRDDTQKLYEITPEDTAQTTYMDLPSQSTSTISSKSSHKSEKMMNVIMDLFRRNQVQTNADLNPPGNGMHHLVQHETQQQTNLNNPEIVRRKPSNGARELSTIIEDSIKIGTPKEVEVISDKPTEKTHVSITNSRPSSSSSSIHELIVEVGSDHTPDAPDMRITPSGKVVDKSSTSDSLDDALKQLGLGWAITTLRKTKQTLQLSSTSASSSSSSIHSNVSLKHVLQQQLKKKIERSSSSANSTEISPEIRELLEYIPSTSKVTTNIIQQIESNKFDKAESSKQLLKTVEHLLGKNAPPDNGRTSTPMFQKTPPESSSMFINQISDISMISRNSTTNSTVTSGVQTPNVNLTVPNLTLDLSKIHSTSSLSTSSTRR